MNIIEITSMDNPLLKEYNKLNKNSQHRQRCSKIALEGPNLVHEALKAGLVPEVVFFTQEYYSSENLAFLNTLPASVKRVVLPQKLFAKISDTENPQAVAAIVYFNPEEKASQLTDAPGLVLILNRLQDPGNMGSIIRTAAAAGVDIVYYTKGSVDPFNPKVMRSTAGSVFHLPVLPVNDSLELIRNLKQNSIKVVAAAVSESTSFWDADYGHKTALIVGNESGGIDQDLLKAADCRVAVPLAAQVESLNAATATAVIIFEIIRRRKT